MSTDDLEKLFMEDSLEALDELENDLLKIEHDNDPETINSLFRAIHSIKGGASLLEYKCMTKLAHIMENYLGAIRSGKVQPKSPQIDALLAGTDLLRSHLSCPNEAFVFGEIAQTLELEESAQEESISAEELASLQVDTISDEQEEKEKKEEESVRLKAVEMEEISDAIAEDIDALLQMSEELNIKLHGSEGIDEDINALFEMSKELDAKLHTDEDEMARSPKEEAASIVENEDKEIKQERKKVSPIKAVSTDQTIRIYVNKLNKLVDLAGELVLARNQLLNHFKDDMQNQSLKNIFQNTDRVTTQLQTEIMGMRMQPISVVFDKFPRLVRDLAAKINKKINIRIEGGSVELDKTIIESISDPLNHLVRNCADHGIESPAERQNSGKAQAGKIILKAFHAGGLVHIEISDDGKGINPNAVVAKAVDQGLINKADLDKLSHSEKMELIFAPGLSTAATISDVSGRGVGMDVVKNNIEKIGGSIEINSQPNKGTIFKITLPLTLAIISSLIVEVEGQKFAIPQVSFEELIRVTSDEFKEKMATVRGAQVLRLRGELVPLMHLADCINLDRTFIHPVTGERTKDRRQSIYSQVEILEDGSEEHIVRDYDSTRMPPETNLKIMIVTTGDIRIGLIVDKIWGFEEIIVKSLPNHLRYLNSYAGVTILGDGKVALIVDVHGIVQKNRLVYEKAQGVSQTIKKAKQVSNDRIMLLLFDNNSKAKFAIPLALIQRIDKIKKQDLKKIGNKLFINYMDKTTRVVELKSQQKAVAEIEDDFNIVIPKNTAVPVALKIGNIIDTKEVSLQLEDNTIRSEFFMGSAIIDDDIVVLLNFHAILEKFEPNCFNREEIKNSTNSKILLVEDTPLYQRMAMTYLKDEGHDVILAENGQEACRKLEKEQFDIVISDIEMPVMNGLELADHIRSSDAPWKNIPIIALTSVTNAETVKQGLQLGINKWLNKIDRTELIKTIDQLLRAE